MSLFWQIALWYIGLINFAAVVLTIVDKRRAKRHVWRVPERTLLLTSAIGGSVGMLVTMLLIRHKTRKAKFMVGIPAIILLQLGALFALWRLGWLPG